MRIGSIVTKSYIQPDGSWDIPEGEKKGVVVGIEFDTRDCDDTCTIDTLTIRWDNGVVVTTPDTGDGTEDLMPPAWEIVDVTPSLYANLYLHDRAYGGPEEGGWWYDTYSPITDAWYDVEPPKHGHFETEELAEAALETLRAWCDDQNSRRRGPSSVASEGHFVVCLEAWPAQAEPTHRPHYC
ncbi:MAG: hypothetical protein AAFV88_05570 [Planctomycetota bacterium]